jgi:glycosyltransferase involved in cell wall biosynthesis
MKLVVVEPVGEGGMVHFAYQMCTAFANEGADVVLITATDYELASLPHNFAVEPTMRLWPRFDPNLVEDPPQGLARLWRNTWWSARRAWRALRLITEWGRVVRYLRRTRPDVIQLGEMQFPGARFLLSRLDDSSLGQICHEFEFRESKYRRSDQIRSRILRRTYDAFDAVFLLGDEVRERFVSSTKVPRGNTHVIPHGNEDILMTPVSDAALVRERYGLDPEDRVVLFFGNIRPSKGLEDLIESFAALRDLDHVKLLIAGFPSREVNLNDFRTQVERLDIEDRVIFDARYIPLEEVGSLLSLSTLVAFPYRNATQSGAIQVAFAAGRPVVATDVGSISEAVEEGKTGFVVDQGSTTGMAEAMRRILFDPDLAAAMGEAARTQAGTRFSWDAIAREVLSVYEGLLDETA